MQHQTRSASPDPHAPATWSIQPWQGDLPRAARRLAAAPGFAWLDSALPMERIGRWSVLACEPRWRLLARGRAIELHEARGDVHRWEGDAFAALAAAVGAEPAVSPDLAMADGEQLPFAGGAIGMLGFELARQVERLPATTRDDLATPGLAFGWYDAALLWDGVRGVGWLAGQPEAVRALRARLAAPDAAAGDARGPATAHPAEALRSTFSRDAYLAAIQRAKRYIEAGDIYQVNLSQRFSVRVTEPPFALYERLRDVSPAPFAAYLDAGEVMLLSSSPERLLLLDGDELETRPIKGTRPRGVSGVEDTRLAAALRRSEKDAAEHVMIVDLERNDLGRIAQVGSVRVPELAALESFAQVHHLTSTVTARRRAGVGLEATLRAIFPGGSVTGAPKIRALEIIDELEPTVRGAYTGAIGYLSAHGRIDLNVAIRTITLAAGEAHFHVGGAIVADSDPAAEYRETLDKARGMARALGVLLPDEEPLGRIEAAPSPRARLAAR